MLWGGLILHIPIFTRKIPQSTIHMIIQSSNSMSPGQPIFEFLLKLSSRYEALDPAIRERTEADWEQFIHLISDINRGHRALLQFREGSWYLRHTLAAARQDVSGCTAKALETIHQIKELMAGESVQDPGFVDLAEYAIAFTQGVFDDPRILSVETPQPSSTVRSSESPQI